MDEHLEQSGDQSGEQAVEQSGEQAVEQSGELRKRDEQVNNQPDESRTEIRQKTIYISIVVVIYSALICVTAVVAFYYYHPLGVGEGLRQTSNFFQQYWNSGSKPKEPYLPPLASTTELPLVPITPCPVLQPICSLEVCSCPPFTEPPCPTPPPRESCDPPTCPAGTCRGPPHCPEKAPPIEVFRTADWQMRELPYWLNLYPPESVERLEVVTSLLDYSYDKFAIDGVMSNKFLLDSYALPCEMCPTIHRNNYINCVMGGELITDKTDPRYKGSVVLKRDESYYAISNALLGHLSAVGPMTSVRDSYEYHPINVKWEESASDLNKADEVFDFFQELIDSYEVIRQDGTVCKVCKRLQVGEWVRCRRREKLKRSFYSEWT